MTKKQPAAKAKRVPMPEPFVPRNWSLKFPLARVIVGGISGSERYIGFFAACIEHKDAIRFSAWLQRAAAWQVDAPKPKGAR